MAVVWFLVLNTLAVLLVVGAAVGWSLVEGRQQAVHFATQSAMSMANDLVAPYCTPELRSGSPDAVATLDQVVRGRIRDGSVIRIKVWTAAGKIIYSDQPALIGRTFDLAADKIALLGTSNVDAEISGLRRSEHEYEDPADRLVEAYIGIVDSAGEPLLFEAYFPTDTLDTNARYIARRLIPTALVTIVALQMLHLPLALALARRLDHAHRSHARLLQHAIAASDVERRRLARDLHDGVIQDLAGVGYSLGSLEIQLADGPAPLRDMVRRLNNAVRLDLHTLRQTMMDIHPPDLASVPLHVAINDLAGPLRTAGVACQIHVPDASGLAGPVRQLVYRAARELLRNVYKHAGARRVAVMLALEPAEIVLTVRDDGVGFDPDNEPPTGHLGLPLLREAVNEAGGSVAVTSVPGRHTLVRVVIPTP